MNRRLVPTATGSNPFYCRWSFATIEALIRHGVIGQPRVEFFPVGWPAGLLCVCTGKRRNRCQTSKMPTSFAAAIQVQQQPWHGRQTTYASLHVLACDIFPVGRAKTAFRQAGSIVIKGIIIIGIHCDQGISLRAEQKDESSGKLREQHGAACYWKD